MKKILELTKDFKIIPENFKSSGELDILEINDNSLKARVKLDESQNIEDYSAGVNTEVFGVNDLGLVYFESRIKNREGDILILEINQDYSIIQRREYSRVILEKGSLEFLDLAEDTVIKLENISAGGLKFISKYELETGKQYKIELSLSDNMHINCSLQPIRITKLPDCNFEISGRFADLENLDRIVLVQYAFRVKMEEQNKEN